MKKLINDVQDVLDEQLAGLAKAHPSLTLHQDRCMSPELMPPLQGKSPCCRVAAADTSRCTVAISVGDAFGSLSGRNFHLTDAR